MQEVQRRFDEALSRVAAVSCRKEATVASVSPRSTMVVIPQRAIRRPILRFRLPPTATAVAAPAGAGDVRMRLYLWLWAIYSARQFREPTYRRTTGDWAELLNLVARRGHQQQRANAARRVAAAIKHLRSRRLIDVPSRDEITLLDPDGSGNVFTPWTAYDLAERNKRREDVARMLGTRYETRRHLAVWEDEHLELPLAVWVNGTVSALSGRALAVLLVLWNFERAARGEPFRVPKVKQSQFGLRNDLWHAGVTELEEFGCVRRVADKSRAPVFAAGVNRRVTTGSVHHVLYKIDHRRLEGLKREQLPG